MTAPRNAGEAFARVLVDELARHGVTDAVLAPGSRSTPVALALAADGRIRLHVRIDERSAAYLAVGLIRATGRPVPVLCTSGTATAHLHGAVMEADLSRLPLLVLTADRPPELRGVGANQTVDQSSLYAAAIRWSCDVGVPEARPESVAYWRSVVSRAVAVLTGAAGAAAGPVHLNLPLREPLTPVDDGIGFPYPIDGRPDGQPWTAAQRAPSHAGRELAGLVANAGRGVVVVGDGPSPADAAAIVAFAASSGWPVLAEPHSGARQPDVAVAAADALLADEEFTQAHVPDVVLVVGRVGLSRTLLGWLGRQRHVLVDRDGSWWDPTRSATAVHRCDPTALADLTATAEPGWLESWQQPGQTAAAAMDALLDSSGELSEPRVARDLAATLPDGSVLVVASSMPIRDLDLMMRPRRELRVVANRGVSGIDGFVSTAQGVALSGVGPTFALAGDLSLLHDSNGFVTDDPPDLTLVVINNDGGGIFSLLPQAAADDSTTFERLFGTPHGVDLRTLAAAYGVRHTLVTRPEGLVAATDKTPEGVHVVEVRTDRAANAELHRALRTAAAAALRLSSRKAAR